MAKTRVVLVKLGTDVVWEEGTCLPTVASAIRYLKSEGYGVIVITSGAVEGGVRHLAELCGSDPGTIREMHSGAHLAGCGTYPLLQRWERVLSAHRLVAVPILVTHSNLSAGEEACAVHTALTEAVAAPYGVPLINENDVVSSSEIGFMSIGLGENDKLLVALTRLILQKGELDVAGILFGTATGGYYTKNPKEYPGDARLVRHLSYAGWEDKELILSFLLPFRERLPNNMVAKVCAALYCRKHLGIETVAIARPEALFHLLEIPHTDPFEGTLIGL